MRQTTPVGASDQSRKRAANRAGVLRTLHFEGPRRRGELASKLHIRKSSITSITAELVEHRFVSELEPGSLRTPLALDAGEKCVVVASIEPDRIVAGRVHLDGSLHAADSVASASDRTGRPDARKVEKAIAGVMPRSAKDVLGIGLAGLSLDPAMQLSLQKRFKLPVQFDTPARCQLWASAWFDRQLPRYRNMIYLGVSTRLSGALILDGRLISGHSASAGEFGHVRAGGEGRICTCGKTDCLETYVSIGAIEQEIARVWTGKPLRGAQAIASASEERVVYNVLDRVISRLVTPLSPILAALDPDAVVLGTESPTLTDLLAKLLRKHLGTGLAGLGARDVPIVPASSDPSATLRGIAAMVIDNEFRGAEQLRQATEDQPVLI